MAVDRPLCLYSPVPGGGGSEKAAAWRQELLSPSAGETYRDLTNERSQGGEERKESGGRKGEKRSRKRREASPHGDC